LKWINNDLQKQNKIEETILPCSLDTIKRRRMLYMYFQANVTSIHSQNDYNSNSENTPWQIEKIGLPIVEPPSLS